jgi:hypothetical protein
MSDIAPEGKANRKIGRAPAVVTRETNRGFGAMVAISHDAPISYIDVPTQENNTVNHSVLYILFLKGPNPDAEIC